MYFRYSNGCCPGTKWESEKETCTGLFKNDTFYHVETFKISSDKQSFSKNGSIKLKNNNFQINGKRCQKSKEQTCFGHQNKI